MNLKKCDEKFFFHILSVLAAVGDNPPFFPGCLSPADLSSSSRQEAADTHTRIMVMTVVVTEQLSLLCARGHLQGGSSLSSSVMSSAAARRVRQLPQLPPKSSTAEQGGPTPAR